MLTILFIFSGGPSATHTHVSGGLEAGGPGPATLSGGGSGTLLSRRIHPYTRPKTPPSSKPFYLPQHPLPTQTPAPNQSNISLSGHNQIPVLPLVLAPRGETPSAPRGEAPSTLALQAGEREISHPLETFHKTG